MKLSIFIVLAYLLQVGMIFGQSYVDLAKFDYAISPNNKFDSSAETTDMYEFNADVTLPIVVNEKFNVLTGITYEYTRASFDPGREEETVSGLALKIGTNIKHNSKWSGTYLLLPKISSDMKELSNDDFQLGGVVLMKYTKSSHFNYRFGAYFNNELFGPFLVPIFGLYYINPDSKFEAKLLLPLAADVNYKLSKNLRLGFNFKGLVRTYNLNTPIGDEESRYLKRSTNEAITYLQYGFSNGIHLQIGAGRSLGRSYRIYDEKVDFGIPLVDFGDDRTQLNSDFSNNWIFKIATFYRLKL